MGKFRMLRLSNQLRDEIANLILKSEVKDPRVSTFLTITRVEISNDLRFAKVFVSSFIPHGQLAVGVEGLNNARGFIQSAIAKRLRIRQFPHLTFYVDENIKAAFDMVEKLNALEKAESQNQSNDALQNQIQSNENQR